MSCVMTATLFDEASSCQRLPLRREVDRSVAPAQSFAPVDLFEFLPELSRRLREEFVLRPEEDLERWDGLS